MDPGKAGPQLIPGLADEDVDRRARGILRQLRSYPLGMPPFLVTEMLARNQACISLLSERLLCLEEELRARPPASPAPPPAPKLKLRVDRPKTALLKPSPSPPPGRSGRPRRRPQRYN